jgi:hypothetical protein
MASLYLLKKITDKFASKTFRLPNNGSELLVAGISKYAIEYTLLKYEVSMYFILLSPTLPLLEISPCYGLALYGLTFSAIPIVVGIPAYRTANSIVNKNLKIYNY